MKKFRFKYENILKMRVDKEDIKKKELADLLKDRTSIELLIFANKEKKAEFEKKVQDALENGDAKINFGDINSGKLHYKNKSDALDEAIRIQNDKIELKKIELSEAMTERKIMEKLKERQFESYILEINKADEKAIAEIVNYNNSMRGKNGR